MKLEEKRKIFEIEYQKEKKPDFKEIFGNDNPLHLEIGSGRGEFIIEKSKRNPNVNFIAVDVKEKRIKTIVRKLDEKLNINVRVIRMFIDSESIGFFAGERFERIYIMFPDPWPKRKHHRRRLINHNFIAILKDLLKPHGILDIVTDHSGYAQWITKHFKERDDFSPYYPNYYAREAEDEHIVTYFEEKMRALGFVPYYFKFVKRGD